MVRPDRRRSTSGQRAASSAAGGTEVVGNRDQPGFPTSLIPGGGEPTSLGVSVATGGPVAVWHLVACGWPVASCMLRLGLRAN